MKRRIALIFLEQDRSAKSTRYMLSAYSKYWEELGFQTIHVFGISKFVDAEIAILNIDLSVVPDAYINFANLYPIALNANVRDIRKSVHSTLRIKPNERFSGPVIVKTNLNHFGMPELKNQSRMPRLRVTVDRYLKHFRSQKTRIQQSYAVYNSLDEVPAWTFEDKDLIIEKFIPEREGSLYCIRTSLFFGDRSHDFLLKSHHPIVKSDNSISIEEVDTHPDIIKLRNTIDLAFGKLDYVVHKGILHVFDINKTPGLGSTRANPTVEKMRRYRAEGIFSFLDTSAD